MVKKGRMSLTSSISSVFNSTTKKNEKEMKKYEKVCNDMKALMGISMKKYDTDKTIRLINVLIPGSAAIIEKNLKKLVKPKMSDEEIESLCEDVVHSYVSFWILNNKDDCMEFKRMAKLLMS